MELEYKDFMIPTADSTATEETRLIHGNQKFFRRTPSFPTPFWPYKD